MNVLSSNIVKFKERIIVEKKEKENAMDILIT